MSAGRAMLRQVALALAVATTLPLATGCGSPPLVGAEGEVDASPLHLTFPDTFVGHPSQLELNVRNQGRAPRTVRVSIAPPFEGPAELRLRGGEAVAVPISFAPSAPGEAEAVLVVGPGEEHIKVQLRGAAFEAPVCDSGGECFRVRFDPREGCVEEPLANGTPCGDACLDQGQCLDGECRGSPKDCGVNDACTLNSCDPAIGCVSRDISESCPPSDDPCRAPVCDPQSGCGFVSVTDGVSCGASDCSSAFICLAGVCTEKESPDGGACGVESPCQEKGICRRGICEQPPRTTLLPTWTQYASGKNLLHFDGTTDPMGNLFWAECGASGCTLVKATGDGFVLFRAAMSGETGLSGSLLLSSGRIVSTLRPGWIEAFDAADGRRVWGFEAAPQLLGASTAGWVELGEVVAHGSLVVALAEGFERDGLVRRKDGWVVAVDVGGGALRWKSAFGGAFAGLVGDASGRLFLSVLPKTAGPTDPASLIALGPSGGESWQVETPFRPPMGAFGDLLLQATSELRTVEYGDRLFDLELMVPLYPHSPLLAGQHGYLFGFPMGRCDGQPCPIWTPMLFHFDPRNGVKSWVVELSSSETRDRAEPVLTKANGILFAEALQGGGDCRQDFLLREIRSSGEDAFACPLPQGGHYAGPTSLMSGRWAVLDSCGTPSIKVFPLQDVEPASKGWVTYRGDPARTGNPR